MECFSLLLFTVFLVFCNVNHSLQVQNCLADEFWVCHVGLSQLTVRKNALLKVTALLIFRHHLRLVGLAEHEELLGVFNCVVEVSRLVIDQTDSLVALRLNLLVLRALCHIETLFVVL